MSTKPHNRGATQQQPSRYPERRMTFETGNLTPETGKLKQETRKPGKGRRGPHLMTRGGSCWRSASPEFGFRSPLPGLERPPVSGFRSEVSGLEVFAGIP